MKETIEVTGVVSFSAPADEYDRRLVIITREMGRISAFAPGSRKPTSPLLAACRAFTFAKFTLYPGKTSYRVVGAQIVEPFDAMSADYDAVTYGSYLLELAGFFSQEGVEAPEIVNLLYVSFKALLNKSLSNSLVRAVFELRILVINGEAPQVFNCVSCNKELSGGVFVPRKHGIGCLECYPATQGDIVLSGSMIYALQFIETAPLTKLYTFTVTEEVLLGITKTLKNYYRLYVNHEFKTLQMLI